jgi:relaxase-like protein
MIGMVYRGEGFRGLVNYLAGKEGSSLLDTNLDGFDPRTFAHQVGEVRCLHPKESIASPVCHIPLRPAPGEDLTNEQWSEVLQLTLERMGFANSPYVAYLHDHDDGRHLHIATYRVNFEGKLVSDSNDRYRILAVAREIEQAYDLTEARPKHSIRLTRPALERLLRDPDRAKVLESLRSAIDQAASKHDTLRGFVTELRRLGVTAEIKVARQSGVLQGIRFALPDGVWIKGSDLGKNYSLAKICNRHELRFDRRPEGRYLLASEVTEREYRSLCDDGLAPDQAGRYGSRRTLYWELPPDSGSGFVELIAGRLPHRFLNFADELPEAPAVVPDLEARARLVRRLFELVEEGPGIAPPLPTLPQVSQASPAKPQVEPAQLPSSSPAAHRDGGQPVIERAQFSAPARRDRPIAKATASLVRTFEKQLVGEPVRAERLARRAATRLWARTSLGRAMLAAAHPLRTIVRASPAAAAVADAADLTSEVVRRSLVLYAELRAAHDRFRAERLSSPDRDLAHGDFSNRSLAVAVNRQRVVAPPVAPRPLPDAVRASRKSEAHLLRSYRAFRRGRMGEAELIAVAARAVSDRAAVTAALLRSLDVATLQECTAVLAARQGRAVSAWILALQRAGLSARAIASSVLEVSSFAIASATAAVAIVAARRLIRWVANHLTTRVLEVLREQNELRR